MKLLLSLLLLACAAVAQQAPSPHVAQKPRAITQDFSSGTWTDTSGNCQHVVSKLPADGDPGTNAVIHASAVEAMLTQFPPAITNCAGDNDDDVALPYSYQDVSLRTSGASAAHLITVLQQQPTFAQAPGTPTSAASTVGPSGDPQASYTTSWTDGNGLKHEVLTRQKWSGETIEEFAVRHSQAVAALAAIFPPVPNHP